MFAKGLGLERGVTGYIYDTVPVVLQAWLRNQHDFRRALGQVIACGGDADTTAAILGGIVGAAVGRQGLPAEWLERLWEWPRSVKWMAHLAAELDAARSSGARRRPPELPVWGIVPRNLLFLGIVLLHGLRRLAPPY